MGAIKPNNYLIEELILAKFGRALAHPARVRTIRLLLDNHQFRNVDLAKFLNLSLSCTHVHIQTLKDAEIIEIEYEPHAYLLKLSTENFDSIKKLLDLPF
jgi:ArsR family transcriptional regulator